MPSARCTVARRRRAARDVDRAGLVQVHVGPRAAVGDDPVERPAQVGVDQRAGREGRRPQPTRLVADRGRPPAGPADLLDPLPERGALAHRPVDEDRGVGQHGHVTDQGVGPQQVGLLGAPDPAAAGRVRIDQVHRSAGRRRRARARWRPAARARRSRWGRRRRRTATGPAAAGRAGGAGGGGHAGLSSAGADARARAGQRVGQRALQVRRRSTCRRQRSGVRTTVRLLSRRRGRDRCPARRRICLPNRSGLTVIGSGAL